MLHSTMVHIIQGVPSSPCPLLFEIDPVGTAIHWPGGHDISLLGLMHSFLLWLNPMLAFHFRVGEWLSASTRSGLIRESSHKAAPTASFLGNGALTPREVEKLSPRAGERSSKMDGDYWSMRIAAELSRTLNAVAHFLQ